MSSNSPFTPDELASFATVTPPEGAAKKEPSNFLTREEAQLLHQQARSDSAQETAFLRGQLTALQQSQQSRTQELPDAFKSGPSEVPVKFNDKTEAVINEADISGLIDRHVQKGLETYHKDNVAPFVPAVKTIADEQNILQAAQGVKNLAPELFTENVDPKYLGQMAIDFYNSRFNTGTDTASKEAYVIARLRDLSPGGNTQTELPRSTGSGYIQQGIVPAFNQTGRTQAGGTTANPYGFAKGAKVELPAKSINELGGIDKYQEYAAWQNGLREYNQRNNMGWQIVEK